MEFDNNALLRKWIHEFLATLSDSFFRVIYMSGNENHKQPYKRSAKNKTFCSQTNFPKALRKFLRHSLFTCTELLRRLLRKFSIFIHSFSYKKIVLVTTLTYYVFKDLRTFACPQEELLSNKKFVRQQSFLRHRRKNLLNLLQGPGVQTTWKIYKMKNVFKGAP